MGPLPLPAVAHIAYQLGHALSHAHQQGIFHGELHPANILIEEVPAANDQGKKLEISGWLAAVNIILSLGFFIIPALLGGRQDMMLANLVDFYTRETLDWNMAAAIGVLLLIMVILLSAPALWMRRNQLVGRR